MARSNRRPAASSIRRQEHKSAIAVATSRSGDCAVLNPLEAIRRHPAMYVGDTGASGLHQLVFKVLDHAVNEMQVGSGDCITIILHGDGSCSVDDGGPGIPIDLDSDSGRPAAEECLTTLNGSDPLRRGLAIVNAFSAWLTVRIRRAGRMWIQRYERGLPTCSLTPRGRTSGHGTFIRFKSDSGIFKETAFLLETLLKRLDELTRSNPALMFVVEVQENEQDEPRPIFLCGRGTRMFIEVPVSEWDSS